MEQSDQCPHFNELNSNIYFCQRQLKRMLIVNALIFEYIMLQVKFDFRLNLI